MDFPDHRPDHRRLGGSDVYKFRLGRVEDRPAHKGETNLEHRRCGNFSNEVELIWSTVGAEARPMASHAQDQTRGGSTTKLGRGARPGFMNGLVGGGGKPPQ